MLPFVSSQGIERALLWASVQPSASRGWEQNIISHQIIAWKIRDFIIGFDLRLV